MSSFMPTGRALQRFHGWLYSAVAAFFLSMPLWIESDDPAPLWLPISLAVAAGLRAAWHFRQAHKLSPATPAFPDHSKLPYPQRAAAVKRALYVGTLAVAALSCWAAWSLHRLETGQAEYVAIWAPISLAYHLGGFWVAVLGFPVLWLAGMANAVRALRRDRPTS